MGPISCLPHLKRLDCEQTDSDNMRPSFLIFSALCSLFILFSIALTFFASLSSLLSHLHSHIGADILVRDLNTVIIQNLGYLQKLGGDERDHLSVKIKT